MLKRRRFWRNNRSTGDRYDRRVSAAIAAVGATILVLAATARVVGAHAGGGDGLPDGEQRLADETVIPPADDGGDRFRGVADGGITVREYRAAVDELFACFDDAGLSYEGPAWWVSDAGRRRINYFVGGRTADAWPVGRCEEPFVSEVLIPWEDQFLRDVPSEGEVASWRAALLDCMAEQGLLVGDVGVVVQLANGAVGEGERAAADACLSSMPLDGR